MSGMEVGIPVIASILGKIAEPLCGSVIDNIGEFHSHLDVLAKKKKLLLDLRDGIKNETEVAGKEGKFLKAQVIQWVKDAGELLVKVDEIQAVKLSRWSINCRKRYRIGGEAAKRVKEIEEFLEVGRSYSGAVAVNNSIPRAVEHIPGPSIQDQSTLSKSLAKTMALLSDDEVQIIGIWGMGGVGKTTLIRNLNNQLMNISSTQPFGIVIWITVSKNFDLKKVQTQIAERLKLEAKMEESSEQMAIQIYRRLVEEKFLLILDDVWEQIDLATLGVPQPEVQKGSKIILTSRSLGVCRNMMTDVDVKVEVLDDEEAWQLFSRNGGSVVALEYIRPVAEAIVKECCGLPLAIVTMGTAMRGKTRVELWKHALHELQSSVPCTGGVENKLYKPLKWSYDSLEGKNIKSCFLYCSLFPEDFSIEISELVQYWLAEGLIDEQENFEDSVNRGIALIQVLKDSCLLEDGAREDTVQMHDVVRDVAIWIASSSEEGCKSLVRSGIGLSQISAVELSHSPKRVSFMNNKINRLPEGGVQCSEASTLLLQSNLPLEIIPETFLQGFTALRVLNLSGTRIRSLPFSLLQLGELRALLLRGCFYLEELPPLEGLSRLRVLDLCATRIRELPRGMENLSNLKQLNLSRTHYLKTIQDGIISRLTCLEVLDMTLSGYHMRVKREIEEEQTSFEELGHLERLLVLSIRLERIPCLSTEEHSWINRLRRFQFFIGPAANSLPTRHDQRRVTISGLNLSGEWIDWLLRNASSLVLNHCLGLNQMLGDLVINSVDCYAGLKSLTIARSNSSLRPEGGCAAQFDLLPNLEELHIQDLTYLESISELVGHLGLRFRRLRVIEVIRCSQMKYLLSCGYFIHTLPKVEVIKLSFCEKLEELFSYRTMQNPTPDPIVPSLRILELNNLPKLKTLCGHETWSHLEQVTVIKSNLLNMQFLTNENCSDPGGNN